MMLDAAAMKKRIALAAAAMVVPLVACLPNDVEAREYDQTCAKDDDCVAVRELLADGRDCSTGCTNTAINKKEKGAYDQDLADSERHCDSIGKPFCDEGGMAACVEGKCTMKR